MSEYRLWQTNFLVCAICVILSGCAPRTTSTSNGYPHFEEANAGQYAARLPQQVSLGNEKVIVVDPKAYAWGAYGADGQLVRGGIATAGGDYCEGEEGSCHTAIGTFHITSLGGENCYSHIYPRPKGGSLMPYCMFFHGGQSLHGSPDWMLVEANISHGCVHIRIPDAEWLRYNFADVGTKVVVLPY